MKRDPEAWLAERNHYLGGSDAATSVGENPYETQAELYAKKTGRITAEDLDLVERVRIGKSSEAFIADLVAERHDFKLRRCNKVLTHPKHNWMRANIDRFIVGRRCGLEIKNVGENAFRNGGWGEPNSDQVPTHYYLQVAHYMAVTGYPEWMLSALVGGNRLVTYMIHRDPELEELLIEGEAAFWRCVETGHAPEPDFSHPTTAELLKKLYPGTDGREIQFGADIEHWHAVKQESDVLAKRYSEASEAAKNHILWTMGEAAIGRLADGSAYRRKIIDKKAFTIDATRYVDCRHVKAKE